MKSTRANITVLKNNFGMDVARILQFTITNWLPSLFGADIRRCFLLNPNFLT